MAAALFVSVGPGKPAVAAKVGDSVIDCKLEYWRAHATEYDTLVLGSSHVLRAFVPAEFDHLMATAGYATHSFNFGGQAVHLIEQRNLLQRVLKESDGRLRRVFFEYEWPTLKLDAQSAAPPSASVGPSKDVHDQIARYSAGHGYLSLEGEDHCPGAEENSYRGRRERFLENQERYREGVEALGREPVAFGDRRPVNAALQSADDFDLLLRIAREVEAREVQFVLVILPSQTCNRPLEERLERELGAPLLRYNLPGRYPELYEPAKRYDQEHLSVEGALDFTRLLARDYPRLWLCPDEEEHEEEAR